MLDKRRDSARGAILNNREMYSPSSYIEKKDFDIKPFSETGPDDDKSVLSEKTESKNLPSLTMDQVTLPNVKQLATPKSVI